jgi:FkbM family methyltransferase
MGWFDRFRAQTPPPVALDRATDTDIVYAYRLILKRDPEQAGFSHYQRAIRAGFSLQQLIRSFENSEERKFLLDEDTRPTPVDLGGYQVLVQKLDTDFAQAILDTGRYEEHVRQALRDQAREGDVCLDIGANIGVLTFLLAKIVGPAGRVIAVEPNPDNLQLLYRGIVLNGLDNVEVLPFAASNARSIVTLAGGISNSHLIGARAPVDRGHFVQTAVLDEILGTLDRLDLVKIDIEGHEPDALQGLSRLIARHRPALVVEYNPRCLNARGQDPSAFLRQLFEWYPRFEATSAFGDRAMFEGAEQLLAYWQRRNGEVAAAGLLEEGLLHFDLVAPRS